MKVRIKTFLELGCRPSYWNNKGKMDHYQGKIISTTSYGIMIDHTGLHVKQYNLHGNIEFYWHFRPEHYVILLDDEGKQEFPMPFEF